MRAYFARRVILLLTFDIFLPRDILNLQEKGLVVHSFSLSLLGGMLFL
jgi:hypothetical protein